LVLVSGEIEADGGGRCVRRVCDTR
jgi:hypothetical protein